MRIARAPDLVGQRSRECLADRVAHEEPLEIQVGGTSLAVLMRTPGHDLELVSGFVLTEGIVGPDEEQFSVHHQSGGGGLGICGRAGMGGTRRHRRRRAIQPAGALIRRVRVRARLRVIPCAATRYRPFE
ncbi:MAG: formate dehydrogenase accessory sulfurtransferase FdhD [SAR324 cluster bacterium]|nr:formate dehydrogenase accessory sulfurtransferase FdhD [SAR324 cluster bacterium]